MGGRLRSLGQTHLEFEWNLVEIMLQLQVQFQNSIVDQIKRSSPKMEGFLSSKSSEN